MPTDARLLSAHDQVGVVLRHPASLCWFSVAFEHDLCDIIKVETCNQRPVCQLAFMVTEIANRPKNEANVHYVYYITRARCKPDLAAPLLTVV